ncbi:hypothetical protein SYNPS1DRAFT_29341 [Syncephalis pseudoplumigaleata]|uniref:Brain protein I3 n=1 Tax=Syncephalis pseudoplumigaleata TaxID=1712513 RepID=A0A4P9YYC0_9FUNG|nr:hypothetical protein SYNPS1DRAFT_29341 [Syncephalis pseudoplumigaleata]|eukprot:RKP24915.1 hypothetical protein SYNPS1DRAFT_29341 [Syncephalis pseudoplumigaleata]
MEDVDFGGGADFGSAGFDNAAFGGGTDFSCTDLGGGMEYGGMQYGGGAVDFGATDFGHDVAVHDMSAAGQFEGIDFNATDFAADPTGFGGGHDAATANYDVHATGFGGGGNGLSQEIVVNAPADHYSTNTNSNGPADYVASFAQGAMQGLQHQQHNNKPPKPNSKPPKPASATTYITVQPAPTYIHATVPGAPPLPVIANLPATATQPYGIAAQMPQQQQQQQQQQAIVHPVMVQQTMMQQPLSLSGVGGHIPYGLVPPPEKPAVVPQQPVYGQYKPAATAHAVQGVCSDGMPHHWIKEHTMTGILLAILLFPCGLIFCQNSSYHQCSRCHQTMKMQQ